MAAAAQKPVATKAARPRRSRAFINRVEPDRMGRGKSARGEKRWKDGSVKSARKFENCSLFSRGVRALEVFEEGFTSFFLEEYVLI